MPEIVRTLAIVPAEMTAIIGMPARIGTPTTKGTVAKHHQQHGFQKQVGTLAVVPATAEMTATVGVPERAGTSATVGTPATVAAAGTTTNFKHFGCLCIVLKKSS